MSLDNEKSAPCKIKAVHQHARRQGKPIETNFLLSFSFTSTLEDAMICPWNHTQLWAVLFKNRFLPPTSAEEVIFLEASICLSVCVTVCPIQAELLDICTGRDTEFRTLCLVCLGSGVLLCLCFIKCGAVFLCLCSKIRTKTRWTKGSEFGVPPSVRDPSLITAWGARQIRGGKPKFVGNKVRFGLLKLIVA